MKIFTTLLVAGALSAGGVLAEPASWAGFYAGAQYGTTDSDVQYLSGGIPVATADMGGKLYGAFAGYDFQNGNIVYGAEIAFSATDVALDANPNNNFSSFVDVKGRLGYAFEEVLFYGVAGYTSSNWTNAGTDVRADGFAYGVGADYRISDAFAVGAEYLVRDMETGVISAPPPETMETRFGTFSVRASYRF